MKHSVKKVFSVLLLMIILAASASVFASDSISIKNVLISGNQATANKNTINGDYYVFSQTLSNTGDISGDLIGFGNNAVLGGKIGGNLRFAGNNITINGQIGKNVTMAGAVCDFQGGSVVDGSVMAAAAKINFDGDINGDVLAGGEEIGISGVIDGDVKLNASKITIFDSAVIKGKLICNSQTEPVIGNGALIGSLEKNIIAKDNDIEKNVNEYKSSVAFTAKGIVRLIGNIGILLLLAFLMYKFIPKKYEEHIQAISKKAFVSFAVGLTAIMLSIGVMIAFIIILIISAFLFTPAVAFVFLFTAIAFYMLVFFLSIIPVSAWLGRLFFKDTANKYLSILTGIAIIKVLEYLVSEFGKLTGFGAFGAISFVICAAIALIGGGAIIITLFNSKNKVNAVEEVEVKELIEDSPTD